VTRERIPWSDRIEAADWIVEQLSDDLASVAWLVPRSLGSVVELVHGDPDWVGSLPVADARLLVEVLRRHTSTSAGCWFGVSAEFGWNGHDPIGGEVFEGEDSDLGPDADMPAAVSEGGRMTRSPDDHPMVRAPARTFMLYHGPIEGAFWIAERCGWEQIPNLWWPDDRAWCVRTDIDLASTYVAGSEALIQDLLAEPRLSARRADPHGRYPSRLLPRPSP
jgi:hypothetical protein